MKVIVTGATGFIGRNITENLSMDGIDVIATGRAKVVNHFLKNRYIDYKTADIRDADQFINTFETVDCVIHCAAKAGDWGRASEFYDVNVLGTRNVMKACEKYGIKKIIFISTPSVYFTGKDRFNISESEPLPANQLTNYAKTKLIAEKELMDFSNFGYRVLIFRPRSVYGPYDNTITPRILQLALKKRFPLINGGKALNDITYVDNLIDVIRTSLTTKQDVWDDVYNISNGEPITIYNWFESVLKTFNVGFNPRNIPAGIANISAAFMEIASNLPFGPEKPTFTRFSVGYMANSMTLSINKAQERLNYSPKIGNEEGFKKYAIWCRNSQIEFSDLTKKS
jgi:nucleoside-diphosphate-sugar epimerase